MPPNPNPPDTTNPSTATVVAPPAIKSPSLTKYLAIVAVATLLVVVVSLVIIRNLAGSVAKNQRLIGIKQQAQQTLAADEKAINNLSTQFAQLSPAIVTELAHALPAESDFPELAAMLESLGGASGVQTKSVSQAAPATVVAGGASSANSGAGRLNVNVDLGTSYASLQQYLRNLELSARPFRISQITFAGSTPALDIKVGLTTYYQTGLGVAIFDQTEAFK